MSSPVNRNPYRQTDPWKIVLLGVSFLSFQVWCFWVAIPRLLQHNNVTSLLNAYAFGSQAMLTVCIALFYLTSSRRESRRFRREQQAAAFEVSRWLAMAFRDEINPLHDEPVCEVPLGDGYGVRVWRRDGSMTDYTLDDAHKLLREKRASLRRVPVPPAGGAE